MSYCNCAPDVNKITVFTIGNAKPILLKRMVAIGYHFNIGA